MGTRKFDDMPGMSGMYSESHGPRQLEDSDSSICRRKTSEECIALKLEKFKETVCKDTAGKDKTALECNKILGNKRERFIVWDKLCKGLNTAACAKVTELARPRPDGALGVCAGKTDEECIEKVQN